MPEHKSDKLAFLMGLILIAAGMFIYLDRAGWLDGRQGGDRPPIVDPDQGNAPDPDKATPSQLAGTYLVVVSESQGRPVAEINVLNDDNFWREWLPENKMKFYLLDPQDADAESYLKAADRKGLQPPFICQVAGTQPLWFAGFPITTSEIKTKMGQ